MTDLEPQIAERVSLEKIYRRNFVYFLIDNILFSLAMGIIGPTTVVPDFIRRLTKSEVIIGLSSSMFDYAWPLPQLFIARYIVRFERKKWWFIGPNIPIRFIILIFAGITALVGKDRPDVILIAFLVCYFIASFGDGLVGVPWADLIGTSLDNRWRARMFGLTSVIIGVMMLGIAPLVGLILSNSRLAFPNNYALLFGVAGVLFVISIFPAIFIHELPGGKAVEKIAALSEFLPGLGRVLRTDGPFRTILIARLLASLFAMAAPFYIGFATVQLGLSSTVAVPTLLAMQTVGSIGGALLYTWLGARSNLMYIRVALVGATLLPISALLASQVGPIPLYVGFFASGLTTSNLFFGFQNWVITYAHADQRPTYIGLFNTITAVISLLAPVIAGTIAQHVGYEALFVVALSMALCALFVTLRYVRDPRAEVVAS